MSAILENGNWLNGNLNNRANLSNTEFNRTLALSKVGIQGLVENFDSIFSNYTGFLDEVSSLRIVPFKLPLDGDAGFLKTTRGTYRDVQVYNLASNKFYGSLGEVFIPKKFNNFADYKGYTYVKAYIPYIGFVDIDVNECMGKWLQFRIYIDYYSGKALITIGVTDEQLNPSSYPTYAEDYNIRVISTFECELGIDIPLGSSNFSDIKRNLILGTVKTVGAIAFTAYTGMLPPPVSNTTTTKTYDIQGRSLRKGSRMKQIKSGTETTYRSTERNRPVDHSKPVAEVFNSSIDALNRNYPGTPYDRSNDALLGFSMTNKVKVVIYRPKMVPIDDNYPFLYGYPLGEVRKLKNITGYAEISSINLVRATQEYTEFSNITATELSVLKNILSDGIII